MRGFGHHVAITRGEGQCIGDDDPLTGVDDVDRHQGRVEGGHVVTVAELHGNRTGVFESDGVLLGVEDTDHDDVGIAGAERRGQQCLGDSGDRIGSLQRSIELGGG